MGAAAALENNDNSDRNRLGSCYCSDLGTLLINSLKME